VGSLQPVALPGGEQAIRQPWRMACAWLQEAAGEPAEIPVPLAGRVDPGRWDAVARLARSGLRSPQTTSVGRLFDAVAALAGVRAVNNYEGQAAIELEAICDPHEPGAFPLPLHADAGMLRLDAREMIRAVAAAVHAGEPPGRIATRFHTGLARGVARACTRLSAEHDTRTVVLAGGVFANRRLLEAAASDLQAEGLRVLRPVRLPAGDGGVAYGQAAAAAWQHRG
jgi:hydrogenase maturation protein HypF